MKTYRIATVIIACACSVALTAAAMGRASVRVAKPQTLPAPIVTSITADPSSDVTHAPAPTIAPDERPAPARQQGTSRPEPDDRDDDEGGRETVYPKVREESADDAEHESHEKAEEAPEADDAPKGKDDE